MLDYMYLWICVLLFIPWVIIYLLKPKLRNRIVKSGFIAIPFGVIDDIWFRLDYWNAPEILFKYPIALEDVLFAFVMTGVSVSIYDAIFTKEQLICYKKRTNLSLSFFPIIIFCFIILNNVLGLNSMYMWALPMFAFAVVIIFFRRDLAIPSLVTGILLTLITIPIYMLLFNIFAPKFWDTYWFLAGTKHGITIFGNVPLLELLHYFSFGCLAGIIYDFSKGTKKVHNKLGKKLFG